MARRQLTELGLPRGALEHRLRTGRLHLLHRGVYAVGHRALTQRAVWMAAVLAAGPDALLAHASAAALLGLRPARGGPVHVLAPGRRRSRPGVVVHVAAIRDDERGTCDGIPVTSPARTILDLAATEGSHEAELALNEAEATDPRIRSALAALLARRSPAAGTAIVRQLLADPAAGVTRSDLEERFARLARAAGLPRPDRNLRVTAGGRRLRLDCAWERERLALELDSRGFHARREDFERDRARDRALQVAGWRVVRVTRRQLGEDPHAVLADLRALLARSG